MSKDTEHHHHSAHIRWSCGFFGPHLTAIVLAVLSVMPKLCVGSTILLASHGQTQYQVVITDDASDHVLAAVKELVRHLNQVTQAQFETCPASTTLPVDATALPHLRLSPMLTF